MSKVGFEIGVQKSITQISENEASFVIVNSPQKRYCRKKSTHTKKKNYQNIFVKSFYLCIRWDFTSQLRKVWIQFKSMDHTWFHGFFSKSLQNITWNQITLGFIFLLDFTENFSKYVTVHWLWVIISEMDAFTKFLRKCPFNH